MTNTGIADGALTALSRMRARATLWRPDSARLLAEQRSPVSQGYRPGRFSRLLRPESPVGEARHGGENEVRGYRGANVGARVRGRGPDRRNTLWVTAQRRSSLAVARSVINAVLSGFERSHAKQQCGPQKDNVSSFFIAFSLCCRRLRSAAGTTPSGWNSSKQFVPRKMK